MPDDVIEAPVAPTTLQKVAAEVAGTFVLVFFGCGSVVYLAMSGDFNIVSIGLTFGLAVMFMAYSVGRVSGGHFNPAVTVGAAVGGRLAWTQVPVYVGSQLVGAIAGGGVLLLLMQGYDSYDVEQVGLGQNTFGDEGSGYAAWSAFLLELLMTAVFVLVILAVTDSRHEHPGLAPLVIGLTLAAIHFVAIPATGTSVNPARSIGPALFAGTDAILQLWLFILAPLAGAVVAGVVYPIIFGTDGTPVAGSGLRFSRPASPGAVPGYGAADQFQEQWNQQVTAGEPIIQDGWQWDPYAQQWIPAPQQPGPAAPAPPADEQTPSADEQTPPDDGHTQFRPPQV